jgi:hypothetical protein
MDNRPAIRATIRGIVLQAVMVAIGYFVPAFGQAPNGFAIAGTILAAWTGAIVPRLSPGAAPGQAIGGGAFAGGVSSLIGGLLALASGQWPGFQALQILYPAISGGVAGGVGGLIGRLMRTPAHAR